MCDQPWDFTSSLRDQRKSTQIKHPDPVHLSRRVVFLRDTWTKPYTALGEWTETALNFKLVICACVLVVGMRAFGAAARVTACCWATLSGRDSAISPSLSTISPPFHSHSNPSGNMSAFLSIHQQLDHFCLKPLQISIHKQSVKPFSSVQNWLLYIWLYVHTCIY